MKKTVAAIIFAIFTAVLAGAGCMAQDSRQYSVKTLLREYTAADSATGKGVYGRYTELVAEGNVPETLKRAVAECNERARDAAVAYVDTHVPEKSRGFGMTGQKSPEKYEYTTYAYIVAVTRADDTAFSILETELESSRAVAAGVRMSQDYAVRFHAQTFETQSGKEVLLTDLTGDENDLPDILEEKLRSRYGVENMVADVSGAAWTADALGIRFYFPSEAVSKEKLQEAGFYASRAVTAAIPYSELAGEKAQALSRVPDEYIAQIEWETLYELPGGLSVIITEKDGDIVLRKNPGSGGQEDLIIEYADPESEFYIIRSQGGFYLFRERIGSEEGFFYDFARPDGGFGRFAYHLAQYFDSFLREIRLALPYNPECVHMAEKRRSFGETSYDTSSFIPHGHYRFPDQPDGRNKRFLLIDESLSIDSYNVACRLLEDFSAVRVDEEGNEAGDVTVKAGQAMILETVTGEGKLYHSTPQGSSYVGSFPYCARQSDGTRIRFTSDLESVLFANGAYMNRFTEPVSLWEARMETEPEPEEAFTVRIGGRDYPVIPDYTKQDHRGEVIDFGDEKWWVVEGYVGNYRMTEEDRLAMEDAYFTQEALSHTEGSAAMTVSEDGHVVLDYFDEVFEGDLPEERRYREDSRLVMTSDSQPARSFRICLREGKDHSVPYKIELFSEGEPATNEPSTVPWLRVFLTKQ